MRTAVFITVRMKSTRLPRKALLKIKGRTTIEHLIDRVKSAKLPDLVVLCTSTHPDDKILTELAKKNGIEAFRGSPEDKLDRYLKAAKEYGIDFIVNVDGDDILCDPTLIDRTIEHFKRTKADCIVWRGFPAGAVPTGIKVESLEKVCEFKDEKDTEVWGGYFTDTGLFKVEYLDAEEELRHPEIRMTLDYPEDLEFFKAIFERLYVPSKIFSLNDVIELLKKNPDIVEINKHRQEEYMKIIEKLAKKIKLRKGKT